MPNPATPQTLLPRDGLRPLCRPADLEPASGRVHLLVRPDGPVIEVFPGGTEGLERTHAAIVDALAAMPDATALRVRREMGAGDPSCRLLLRVEGASEGQMEGLARAVRNAFPDTRQSASPAAPAVASDERSELEALAAQLRADLARIDAERGVLRADLRVLEQEIREIGGAEC